MRDSKAMMGLPGKLMQRTLEGINIFKQVIGIGEQSVN